MFNKRRDDFVSSMKRVFNTRDGKVFLKYLKEDYLAPSAKKQTVEETYYAIGQQDFVKRLLVLVTESSLEDIRTVEHHFRTFIIHEQFLLGMNCQIILKLTLLLVWYLHLFPSNESLHLSLLVQ